MSMTQNVHLQLPEHLLKEAERLVPVLARDADLAVMGRMSRALVLRLALQKGLEVLKRTYEPAPNS
jgi:hypothetical protein